MKSDEASKKKIEKHEIDKYSGLMCVCMHMCIPKVLSLLDINYNT